MRKFSVINISIPQKKTHVKIAGGIRTERIISQVLRNKKQALRPKVRIAVSKTVDDCSNRSVPAKSKEKPVWLSG